MKTATENNPPQESKTARTVKKIRTCSRKNRPVVHALVQLGVMSGGDFRAGVQRNSRLNDNIIIDDNTLIDNNIKLVSAGLKSKIKRDNGSPEMTKPPPGR